MWFLPLLLTRDREVDCFIHCAREDQSTCKQPIPNPVSSKFQTSSAKLSGFWNLLDSTPLLLWLLDPLRDTLHARAKLTSSGTPEFLLVITTCLAHLNALSCWIHRQGLERQVGLALFTSGRVLTTHFFHASEQLALTSAQLTVSRSTPLHLTRVSSSLSPQLT